MNEHPCTAGSDGTPCRRIRQGEAYTLDQCRLCWLFAHDTRYSLLWGGDGRVTPAPAATVATPAPDCPAGHGPGTELKKLLTSLGITQASSCDCRRRMLQMDAWGVDGCKQRREEIAQTLRDNAPRWGWAAKLKAGALAVAKGVAFQMDLSDPYGSLVDLAIKRAEEAEMCRRACA